MRVLVMRAFLVVECVRLVLVFFPTPSLFFCVVKMQNYDVVFVVFLPSWFSACCFAVLALAGMCFFCVVCL